MATVDLYAHISGGGPPLLILHGLLGSSRNWAGIARGLADIRQSHALDLRNHGQSPWSDRMDYPLMAADVAAYLQAHGLAHCDLLGHSMGGKTAMLLALTRPDLIRRLIIVDIAPVSYSRESFSTYIGAMRQVDLSRVTRRADVDAALSPAIPDPTLRAFLQQNLVNENGRFSWRPNLAGLAAALPATIAFPDSESSFAGPTTFFAGETSDYIRPRDEIAIRRHFPAARIIEIGNTGHWPHADQPARFLELTRHALEE